MCLRCEPGQLGRLTGPVTDVGEEDRVGGCGAAFSLLPARGDDAGLFTPSPGFSLV